MLRTLPPARPALDRSARPALFALFVLLALALGLDGCTDARRRSPGQASTTSAVQPQGPVPGLRLIGVTDLGGYLEPCGCQSVPLGGIDKAAAELDRLARDGAPALLVSVGDLFFEAAGGNQGTSHDDPGVADASTQQRWQAETLAGVLQKMRLAAHVPGPSDLNHGPQALSALAKLAGTPLLAAGAQAPAGLLLGETRIVERGGLKVGLWGLSDFGGYPTGEPDGAERAVGSAATAATAATAALAGPSGAAVPASGGAAGVVPPTDLIAEATRLTAQLRASGVDLVIGLLRADGRTARRLTGAVKGLDFVLHGGLDSPDFPPPERIGDATLLRSGHRGHGLLVVDIFNAETPTAGGFVDQSEWTRASRRAAVEKDRAALEARVAGWEKEGQDAALIAQQRARLAAMQAELETLQTATAIEGKAFSARYIRLDPDVGGAQTIRVLLEEHDKRVNEHNRTAFADIAPPPVPEGQPGYVGSERCGQCHAAALGWWTAHRHGNAYATLEKRNKQFNLSCVGCHVTGYNRPGGATVVQNQGLTDVGCESCHGPGSEHAKLPTAVAAVNVTRAVPESTCTQCHVPEHSDRFDYKIYKAMLMAPGHGKPARGHTAVPSNGPAEGQAVPSNGPAEGQAVPSNGPAEGQAVPGNKPAEGT